MVGVASVGEFVSPSGPEQAPVECELCLSCSSVRSRRRAKPKRATGGNVSQCGLTEQRAEGFFFGKMYGTRLLLVLSRSAS